MRNSVVRRLLKMASPLRGAAAEPTMFSLPAETRIYAIGDVHGCLGPLERLETKIRRSADGFSGKIGIVFLGDYIDRGPDVAGVIEHLSKGEFAGFPTRYLMGNHEDILLQAFTEPGLVSAWLRWGGMATLASYRVAMPQGVPPMERDRLLASAIHQALPRHHLEFIERLELDIRLGDYYFVHAGVRPKRTLAKQSRHDLLTIREPFLSSRRPLPVRVVHGHSVSFEPQIEPYRIGVDTGAYATGNLSCVMLEGCSAQVLSSED
jgi:serine/threonine protein phosphatase 1